MRLKDEKEVKKWLRNLPILKRELELKVEFYKDLAGETDGVYGLSRAAEYYRETIDELREKVDKMMSDIERLLGLLNESERLIMTAKYIRFIRWDFIELHVFYSRRQSIRIHNEAIKKLVGQEVSDISL